MRIVKRKQLVFHRIECDRKTHQMTRAECCFIDGLVSSFCSLFAANGKFNEEIIAKKNAAQKDLINCSTCGMKSENSAAAK